MKDLKISLEQFKEIISKHQSFIVNYGKGENGEDIKEEAYWDEKEQLYDSETGHWGFKTLYKIANGEVENTSIELCS